MPWPFSADRDAPDTPVTVAAWGATVAWLLISALVFFGMSGGEAGLDPLRVMMVPVAIFGPVALIWIAAFLTRRVSRLTRAVERLEAGGDLADRLDTLVRGQKELAAAMTRTAPAPRREAPDADLPDGAAAPEERARPEPVSAEATAASRRAAREAARRGDAQPASSEAPSPVSEAPAVLSSETGEADTGTPVRAGASSGAATAASAAATASGDMGKPARPTELAEPTASAPSSSADGTSGEGKQAAAGDPPLATGTLIHALQFPADAEDKDGFRALRRALRDPGTKPAVTAAQDMLTLLAELGLYMDDVAPPPASAETWRRFAAGEREDMAEIAGPENTDARDRIARRLESDEIFRDTANHFARMFERLLAGRAPDMSDEELRALGGTRSARAFSLMGRALGMLD